MLKISWNITTRFFIWWYVQLDISIESIFFQTYFVRTYSRLSNNHPARLLFVGCLSFCKPLFGSMYVLLFITKVQFQYCWLFFSLVLWQASLLSYFWWSSLDKHFLLTTIFQSKNSVYFLSTALISFGIFYSLV